MPQTTISIRAATAAEDPVVAAQFYQMWRDNEVPSAAIISDWQTEVQRYLDQARQCLDYRAFVAEAEDLERQIVGSASCQRFAGLYPNILEASYRQDGYIWGVYVEPDFRGRGIAKQLTTQAVDYLRSIGCTHAVLNASPTGRSVYSSLGFADGNLMRRTLT